MREHLTFLLNGEPVAVRDVAPTTTLLQWLRRTRRLTGSKEGCAAGDCGACTVVVASLDNGQVRYHAINACLILLPMLEGRLVLTVDGLAGPDEQLHPVQQALVDAHGSQCGFCTPGFVMSLTGVYLAGVPLARAALADSLAGNLCRCTGYGPILDAGARMFDLPRPAWDRARRAADAAAIAAIAHGATLDFAHAEGRYLAPTTLDDLADLAAANPTATIVSGATDIGLWVTKQQRALPVMIHTGRVAELSAIIHHDSHICIGAGVTWAAAHAALAAEFPELGELIRRFAGVQIRNAATVGGNIANGSPIGDAAPPLIALGATLVLRHADTTRRIALEDFFVAYGRQDRAPGEIVVALEIARLAAGDIFKCYKVSKRFDDDVSAACAAFNLRLDSGRVTRIRAAFGGMAATPKRAAALEAMLLGQPWTEATLAAAHSALARDFTPISDARASASYRMAVARNLVTRLHIETTTPGIATRLVGAATAFP